MNLLKRIEALEKKIRDCSKNPNMVIVYETDITPDTVIDDNTMVISFVKSENA